MNAARDAWEEQQSTFGCTHRAVLFKQFPNWLNAMIHRRHVRFVLRSLLPGVRTNLDAGCGYGRVAEALVRAIPGVEIKGVEP